MVTLPDECLDSFKKSDSNKYLNFWTKGVKPELCELWDEVFRTIMAMGKNVMAPGMKKKQTSLLDVVNLDNDCVDASVETHGFELDSLLDCVLLYDEEVQLELVYHVTPDATYKDCLNSVYDSITALLGTRSGPSKQARRLARATWAIEQGLRNFGTPNI